MTVHMPMPQCGNGTPHEAHSFPGGYDQNTNRHWDYHCRGWTQTDKDLTFFWSTSQHLILGWMSPLSPPPGARVECHPLVHSRLIGWLIPDFGLTTKEEAEGGRADVPVIVMAGMEHGAWRIVSDEGTIVEGKIHDG